MNAPHQVHVLSGILGGGRRVRAACWCGFTTTPRVSTERVLAAFGAEHLADSLVCDRTRGDLDYLGRPKSLRVLEAGPGEQVLVCRDDEWTCSDLAQQRQVHLDRVGFAAFGVEPPRPRLRVVQRPT